LVIITSFKSIKYLLLVSRGYNVICACVSDGSTSSATALRGSYGCAGIHEVTDFYDSSPFVYRPAVDQSSRTLTDITSHTNNTQLSDAAVAGHKGYYAQYIDGEYLC